MNQLASVYEMRLRLLSIYRRLEEIFKVPFKTIRSRSRSCNSDWRLRWAEAERNIFGSRTLLLAKFYVSDPVRLVFKYRTWHLAAQMEYFRRGSQCLAVVLVGSNPPPTAITASMLVSKLFLSKGSR